MARKFAATAAVLALAGVLAAGCSKKLTTDPSFKVPEGTPSSQIDLITYFDQPTEKIRIHDRGQLAKVDFVPVAALSDSIELDPNTGSPKISIYRSFSPGTVRGLVIDQSGSEAVEIWRTDSNGGVRRLFDFTLQPIKRYLTTGTNLYEFYDADSKRPANCTYYARGVVGGIAGQSSPLSSPSTPNPAPITSIGYLAERFGTAAGGNYLLADSNITMQWTPVAGASRYLIQIFQYQSKVLTLEQRILTGTPSPLLSSFTHSNYIASVPGGITTYTLRAPGATVYEFDPLRKLQEYWVRITAIDAGNSMIGTTTGPDIQSSADLLRIPLWPFDQTPRDYFVDMSAAEVASATPPAYLIYSRGAIWVSPGAKPEDDSGGGGGGP